MSIRIGNRTLDIPLIQGGMGIGISLGRLAGSVAARGGMGTISAAGVGFKEPDFDRNFVGASIRALKKEISLAKKISQGCGMIAVNIMTAMNYFEELAIAAAEAGADAIVSGAGLPKSLPEYIKGTGLKIAPVVSGSRAASVICRLWDRHYGTAPDFVVVEGSRAGGHLGFSRDQLEEGSCQTLEEIIPEVKSVIAEYEKKYGKSIPVFAAGGIRSREEAEELMQLGADGIQLATAFIATEECDASREFKETLCRAGNEEVAIVTSPVGMPGRAIRTPLIEKVSAGLRVKPEICRNCIKVCDPGKTPYCISGALIAACKGDYENGLFFCGDDIDTFDRIRTVDEVIRDMMGPDAQ